MASPPSRPPPGDAVADRPDGPDGPADPHDPAAVLVGRLLPALARYRRALARDLGLDDAELACVETLVEVEDAPVSLIGARCGLSGPAASRMITRLERAGWVERLGSGPDGRTVLVAARPGVDAALARARAPLLRRLVRDVPADPSPADPADPSSEDPAAARPADLPAVARWLAAGADVVAAEARDHEVATALAAWRRRRAVDATRRDTPSDTPN